MNRNEIFYDYFNIEDIDTDKAYQCFLEYLNLLKDDKEKFIGKDFFYWEDVILDQLPPSFNEASKEGHEYFYSSLTNRQGQILAKMIERYSDVKDYVKELIEELIYDVDLNDLDDYYNLGLGEFVKVEHIKDYEPALI